MITNTPQQAPIVQRKQIAALTYAEASKLIDELKKMRDEYREKMEGKDDGRYWY